MRQPDTSRTQDEGGFTLVELAVTMLLASIVLAITVTVFSTAQNSASTTQQRFTATADAENAMQVVSQAIRAALPTTTSTDTQSSVAFVAASADEVSFYASLGATDQGSAPTLVTFTTKQMAGGAYYELLESQIPAGGTPPSYTFDATPKTSIVAYWLSPTAGNSAGAIFQYFAAGSSSPLTPPAGSTGSQPPSLSTASMASITSVQVTITCATGQNQPEATMQSMIYPPNLANSNGVVGI